MGNDMAHDPVITGLKIDYRSGRPVYAQITDGVKALIYAGKLKTGFQLPTVRALASALDINPNTAARAYRELAFVPYRQWVLVVPKRLRYFLNHNPALAGELSRIFADEINRFLCQNTTGTPAQLHFKPQLCEFQRGGARLF
jgi:DNA-binding transcriptional MocR family regulator